MAFPSSARLERLDAEPVRSARVEQHRMLVDDLLEMSQTSGRARSTIRLALLMFWLSPLSELLHHDGLNSSAPSP